MNFPKPTIPLPAGVTVRQIGDPTPARPRNALERAAMAPDVEVAKRILCELLGLSPESPLAQINLSCPDRWKRIGPCSRLMEIAAWLKSECYECMDLVEASEVSTRGD